MSFLPSRITVSLLKLESNLSSGVETVEDLLVVMVVMVVKDLISKPSIS